MSLSPEQLHVIRCYDRLPPMPGGMERHVAELTKAQRALGVRVTLIHNSGEALGESIRVLPAIRTDRLRPNHLRWAAIALAALTRRIDHSDNRIRVVHVHGDWPAFAAGTMLARRFNSSVLAASVHGRLPASNRCYALALRRFDPIFATGLQQARQVKNITGKAVLHLPSAPAELFFEAPKFKKPPVDVIAVGSFVPVKNFELVLECAARLPQYRFRLLGNGLERPRLQTLASVMGLANVEFGGAVSLEEVQAHIHSAKLFVSSSLTEGSPTAALEAMACGLPVILTPSNDYSQLVSGAAGKVTRGFDPDELAGAIADFLTNPKKLSHGGREARSIAQSHRWPIKARLVTEAMIAACERRGDRRS